MTRLVDDSSVVDGKSLPVVPPLDGSELPQVDDTAQGLQRDQEHLEVDVTGHDGADAPEPIGVADEDHAPIVRIGMRVFLSYWNISDENILSQSGIGVA